MKKKKKPKSFLDSTAWESFEKEYSRTDDRSTAILLSAYLDICLEVLLRECIVNSGEVEDLFGEQGSLGTFSAKIDMAYAINLLPKTFRADLHQIRKIRNRFAHDLHGLTFSTNDIQNHCRALTTPKDYPTGTEQTVAQMSLNDPRQLFLFTAAILSFTFETHYKNRAVKLATALRGVGAGASVASPAPPSHPSPCQAWFRPPFDELVVLCGALTSAGSSPFVLSSYGLPAIRSPADLIG